MKQRLLFTLACAFGTAISQAQVTQLVANQNLEFIGLVSPAKAVFASGVDHRLYVSDGTSASTALLSSAITYDEAVGIVGNKLLFKGNNAAAGSELFVTDGTAAGTTLLKDIYAGTTGSEIDGDVAMLNGYVYFSAVTAAEGREIWKSNGTAAGTTLLKDIVPGSGNSNIAADYNLFSNGSYLLFSAESSNGYELWKSDGSTAGTMVLSDINTGAGSSNPENFFQLGNTVLFQAQTPAAGKEIWKTNGTTTGTVLVKDIHPGTSGSEGTFNSSLFFEFNGRAYFSANDGVHGEEIWYTDGTAANTNLLKDIETGDFDSFDYLFNAVKVGNKFIFGSTNLTGSRAQLMQSDGTAAGTTVLKDFSSATSQIPIVLPAYDLTALAPVQQLFQGNKFFFIGTTPNEGTELWVSDGTVAGTTLVKDIRAGTASSITNYSYQYTSAAFYFAANNGTNGNELWKTDATNSGTSLVADIRAGTGSSNPQIWPVFNNKLTLSANNGDNAASDLYVLNGDVIPLPIKLTEFTVAATNGDALLRWTTSQEVNSDQFTIQRSPDGIHFQNIGSIKAASQSTGKTNYSFTDVNVLQYGKETLYYRLQAADRDGKTELTKVITLLLSGTQWNVKLLNNPVPSTLQLTVTGSTTTTSFKITDVSGKSYSTALMSGSGTFTIPVDDLPAGIYFLVAENGKVRKTERFIKN